MDLRGCCGIPFLDTAVCGGIISALQYDFMDTNAQPMSGLSQAIRRLCTVCVSHKIWGRYSSDDDSGNWEIHL